MKHASLVMLLLPMAIMITDICFGRDPEGLPVHSPPIQWILPLEADTRVEPVRFLDSTGGLVFCSHLPSWNTGIWSEESGSVNLFDLFPALETTTYTDLTASASRACGFEQYRQAETILGEAFVVDQEGTQNFLGHLPHSDLQVDSDLGEVARQQLSIARQITPDGQFVFGVSITGILAEGNPLWVRQRRELFLWSQQTGMIGLGLIPGQSDDLTDYSNHYIEILEIADDGTSAVGMANMLLADGVRRDLPWMWTVENGLKFQSPYGPYWTSAHSDLRMSPNGRYLAGAVTTPASENCDGFPVYAGYVWDLEQPNREGLRWIPRVEGETSVNVMGVSNQGAAVLRTDRICQQHPDFQFHYWKIGSGNTSRSRINLTELIESRINQNTFAHRSVKSIVGIRQNGTTRILGSAGLTAFPQSQQGFIFDLDAALTP